jgi:hypothetical protein
MVLIMDFPRLWAFGKDTGTSDGVYGLPANSNLRLWKKAMSCYHCKKIGCKQRKHRRKLWHIPAFLVPVLFKIRYLHCGKEWRGACEKFFKEKR